MSKNYFEVTITFNKNNIEQLYNALYMYGIKNILEENGMVRIYFSEDDEDNIASLKVSLMNDKVVKEKDFSVNKFEDKNWNKVWEESIEPVFIKDKIIIYPSWKKEEIKETEGKILIEIDPKMSFGTGHNETTQLILELMCENLKGEEELMLDYGCGTGILTIAGIKLGINNAVALDIDEDSVNNAEENFKKNSVSENVVLYKSNISEIKEESFDVICANIIRSVIIENIEHISNKIKSKGKLFLSGILISEDQEILEYLTQHDFEVIDIISKSEWISIYAEKF